MKPIHFKEETKVLQRPLIMPHGEECGALPVWNDGRQCVSCWKPTFAERVRILCGGNVWLGVMYGKTQPPVFVTGERPFVKTPIISHIRAFLFDCGDFIRNVYEKAVNVLKQRDKRIHFIVGFIISLIFGSIVHPVIGFGVGTIAGAAKEWGWDASGKGTVDKVDFICTTIGAALAVPFSCLLYPLIH